MLNKGIVLKWMKDNKLTQRNLAQKLGISPQRINNIFREQKCTIKQAQQIAQLMNVEVEKIYTKVEKEQSQSKEETVAKKIEVKKSVKKEEKKQDNSSKKETEELDINQLSQSDKYLLGIIQKQKKINDELNDMIEYLMSKKIY